MGTENTTTMLCAPQSHLFNELQTISHNSIPILNTFYVNFSESWRNHKVMR